MNLITKLFSKKEKTTLKPTLNEQLNINDIGTTTNNKRGISISYERDSFPAQQNFTKCHELGHLFLKHRGENFTLLPENDTQQEANLFSAFILIPDIILYHKIVNQGKNFSTVKNELQMSEIALKYRLINFLQIESKLSKAVAEKYEYEYQIDNNAKNLITILKKHEETILEQYKQIQADTYLKAKATIAKYNFITSLKFPELSDKELQDKLSQENNVKIWSYYNRGKTLWYAWNTDKLSDIEAQREAKLIHTLKLLWKSIITAINIKIESTKKATRIFLVVIFCFLYCFF